MLFRGERRLGQTKHYIKRKFKFNFEDMIFIFSMILLKNTGRRIE